MKRRDFIRHLMAGSAAAAGVGAWPFAPLVRSARGQSTGWGAYPEYALESAVPEGKRCKNVLEVFVHGGLCPWESFYAVDLPEYGKEAGELWWTFQDTTPSVSSAFAACAGALPLLKDFRVDELGVMVKLGPFTEPLRSRTDIVSRLRMHVLQHNLEPHTLAIPLGTTGFRSGDPKMAGVGTAVNRYFRDHDPNPTTEPYSYVFVAPVLRPEMVSSHWATGAHSAAAQPVWVRVDAGVAFAEALQRRPIAARKEVSDALWSLYTDRYRGRMTTPGGLSVRAPDLREYAIAQQAMLNNEVLGDIFTSDLFATQAFDLCGEAVAANTTRTAFHLAAEVLTRPGTKARHVTVVDSGSVLFGGKNAYDTHQFHVERTAPNLYELWRQLIAVINEPGEDDPRKLNLEETLVVINTEFGRAPGFENVDGRAHWPYGYVAMMFGGPIGPDQQGIVGAIGPDGYATNALRPTETRAAILAALGIYPFMPEAYAPDDVAPGSVNSLEAGLWLRDVVLGLT